MSFFVTCGRERRGAAAAANRDTTSSRRMRGSYAIGLAVSRLQSPVSSKKGGLGFPSPPLFRTSGPEVHFNRTELRRLKLGRPTRVPRVAVALCSRCCPAWPRRCSAGCRRRIRPARGCAEAEDLRDPACRSCSAARHRACPGYDQVHGDVAGREGPAKRRLRDRARDHVVAGELGPGVAAPVPLTPPVDLGHDVGGQPADRGQGAGSTTRHHGLASAPVEVMTRVVCTAVVLAQL